MHATATKENSTSHSRSQPSKPFFSKKGEDGLFAPAQEVAKPFFAPALIQPKLTINEPGDSYEQEADAMADRVMRMSAPSAGEGEGIAPPPHGGGRGEAQRKCAACEGEEKVQRQEMEEEEPLQTAPLMRKAEGGGYTASPQLTSQLNSSKGGGDPLPKQTLGTMNQAFGADFSKVRVHTGTQAAEMSQGIQAKAFTYGSDIYFNRGQYSPETSEGKRLLGHELTHVVQQGLSRDTISTIHRWKISGNEATANDESDSLGGLAIKVGAHFNDWKCIRPLKMQTFASGTATEHQKKNYELFVQLGDQFDVSNLITVTGPELKIYLFNEGMDAEIAKRFYPGSIPSSGDPDTDISTKANDLSKSTPVQNLLIFGHAAGGLMYGELGSFNPSKFEPEEPAQLFGLAEYGFFPRRCWLTRNAKVRLVGCDSEALGKSFSDAYLRKGATVTTTTRAVGSLCTYMLPGTMRCLHPNALLFAAHSSRNAPTVDGPFTSVDAFHGSRFWKTFKGKL